MCLPELREGGEAMSMLGSQADRLRLTADVISERGVSSGDLAIIEIRLREAADTITSLSDKLQGVMGTRYNELFGTPERAARTLIVVRGECESVPCSPICPFGDAPACPSNFESGDYDELLDWLRGDA